MMALQRDSGGRIRSLDQLLLPSLRLPFLSPPPLIHQSLSSLPPPLPLLRPVPWLIPCLRMVSVTALFSCLGSGCSEGCEVAPSLWAAQQKASDGGPPCRLDSSGFPRRQAGLLGTCAWKSNSCSPAACMPPSPSSYHASAGQGSCK